MVDDVDRICRELVAAGATLATRHDGDLGVVVAPAETDRDEAVVGARRRCRGLVGKLNPRDGDDMVRVLSLLILFLASFAIGCPEGGGDVIAPEPGDPDRVMEPVQRGGQQKSEPER